MKTLLYNLIPYALLRAIRQSLQEARSYKLALQERPRIYGRHIDPL